MCCSLLQMQSVCSTSLEEVAGNPGPGGYGRRGCLGHVYIAESVTITPALSMILLPYPALPIPVRKMAEHSQGLSSQHFLQVNNKTHLSSLHFSPAGSSSTPLQPSSSSAGLEQHLRAWAGPPTAAPCQRCSTSPTTSERLCLAMPCTACDIARWAEKLAFF